MELLLLLKLKWDIMVPTTKDFLVELVNHLEEAKFFDAEHKAGIKRHANAFIDLITLGKCKTRNFPILYSLLNSVA